MNSSVANFQDLLLAAVDGHVPLMKLRRNSSPPWIDKAVLKLIKKKENYMETVAEQCFTRVDL